MASVAAALLEEPKSPSIVSLGEWSKMWLQIAWTNLTVASDEAVKGRGPPLRVVLVVDGADVHVLERPGVVVEGAALP